MTKSVKIAILFIISLFVLSVVALLVGTYWAKSNNLTAEIYQNGTLIHSIDLSKVTNPYEILVERDNASNTILVEPGKISIQEASCPDHICVRTGKINSPLMPITCLPNKLVIKITGGTDDEFDIMSY